MRFEVLIGLLLALNVSAGRGEEPEPKRFEFEETHMGSPFKMILYTSEETTARRASRAAFDRIKGLDDVLSDYNPESEVMRLCASEGGIPRSVGPDLFEVLSRSIELSRRTEGAFDVTIGPVGRLWRRARRERKLPEPKALENARKLVGWTKVGLDPASRSVRLESTGMRIDFGGIAKGFASDQAVQTLKSFGITSALVAGAGDITVSDPPPGRPGWMIDVADLERPGVAPPRRRLTIKGASVSTSGDSERYVEIDGKRYSHILDPASGVGMTRRSSITVVAADGATADGLATALSVLPFNRGRDLVESFPNAAAYVVVLDQGRISEFETSRLGGYLSKESGRRDAP